MRRAGLLAALPRVVAAVTGEWSNWGTWNGSSDWGHNHDRSPNQWYADNANHNSQQQQSQQAGFHRWNNDEATSHSSSSWQPNHHDHNNNSHWPQQPQQPPQPSTNSWAPQAAAPVDPWNSGDPWRANGASSSHSQENRDNGWASQPPRANGVDAPPPAPQQAEAAQQQAGAAAEWGQPQNQQNPNEAADVHLQWAAGFQHYHPAQPVNNTIQQTYQTELDWQNDALEELGYAEDQGLFITLQAPFRPPDACQGHDHNFRGGAPLGDNLLGRWIHFKVWFRDGNGWGSSHLFADFVQDSIQWHHPQSDTDEPPVSRRDEEHQAGLRHPTVDLNHPQVLRAVNLAYARSHQRARADRARDQEPPPELVACGLCGRMVTATQPTVAWFLPEPPPDSNQQGGTYDVCNACNGLILFLNRWWRNPNSANAAAPFDVSRAASQDLYILVARLNELMSVMQGTHSHSPMGYHIAPIHDFVVRQPGHRFNKNFADHTCHAHQFHCHITSAELGSLLSNIKHCQGTSTTFNNWWKLVCAFFFGGTLDPARLPIAFLIQAAHTEHAYRVLSYHYSRGGVLMNEVFWSWRIPVINRVGGIPICIPNPDTLPEEYLNPMADQEGFRPIPDDYDRWKPPPPGAPATDVPESDDLAQLAEFARAMVDNPDNSYQRWVQAALITNPHTGEQPPAPACGSNDNPWAGMSSITSNASAVLSLAVDHLSGIVNDQEHSAHHILEDFINNQDQPINNAHPPAFRDRDHAVRQMTYMCAVMSISALPAATVEAANLPNVQAVRDAVAAAQQAPARRRSTSRPANAAEAQPGADGDDQHQEDVESCRRRSVRRSSRSDSPKQQRSRSQSRSSSLSDPWASL